MADSSPSVEAMSTAVLGANDLSKFFNTGSRWSRRRDVVRAVDGVSFDLAPGETLGVVGESGCGKSTLARMLVALTPPSGGSLQFHGEDLTDRRRSSLFSFRRQVQMVFQDPYASLDPRMRVADLVAEPFGIHKDLVPRAQRRARVEELLQQVGLQAEHADRYPHQFSGGQRQRIGIARALAVNPSVLVCDEPVSALDVSVQAQVVNLLKDLQRDVGLSYVFIAHDLAVVRAIAHRVAVMYLGRIVEAGTVEDIYERPSHPYTQALLSSIPQPTPKSRATTSRIVLPGDPPSPARTPSGCRFRTRCWKATSLCAEQDPAQVIEPAAEHRVECHYPEPGLPVSRVQATTHR